MFFGGLGHVCKFEWDAGSDLFELRQVDSDFFEFVVHVTEHI